MEGEGARRDQQAVELGVAPERGADRRDQRPDGRRGFVIGERRHRLAGEDHAHGDVRRHAGESAGLGAVLAKRAGPQPAYGDTTVGIAMR
jgi:hypothetical protein